MTKLVRPFSVEEGTEKKFSDSWKNLMTTIRLSQGSEDSKSCWGVYFIALLICEFPTNICELQNNGIQGHLSHSKKGNMRCPKCKYTQWHSNYKLHGVGYIFGFSQCLSCPCISFGHLKKSYFSTSKHSDSILCTIYHNIVAID